MKTLKTLLVSILLLILNSCNTTSNTIEDIMNNYAENGRREIGSPFTGTVLVAKNGKILFTKSYGLKDRTKNIPNETDTKFRIGSITKQFVAMLVMQLMEEGSINLEDPVTTYLDYLPRKYDEITIHQLLSHTSGLPHYEGFTNMGMKVETFAATSYTPRELALLVGKVELISEPGTSFHYSSLGYMLLGTIIENTTGKSFSELLESRITTPLGLKNTGFASNTFIEKETSKGYIFKEDETFKMIFMKFGGEFEEAARRDQSNVYTAGGMHSTVHDLFIWSEAIKNYTLISKETTKLMLTPVQQGFAYGWVRNWDDIIERNTKAQLYSHTGSTFGHASAISMFDDGTTIIFTTNVNRIRAQKIIHKLYLAANKLEDIYGVKGYPDRGSLAEFEAEGGIKALNTYFKKVSDICGYEVKPSESSIQQVIALYYENTNNIIGDSILKAYIQTYGPSENDMNRLGYKIIKSNCQKAIDIFKINAQNHPDSANTWDSLGEGYIACTDYKQAINSFEHAVKIAIKTKHSELESYQEQLEKAKSLLN